MTYFDAIRVKQDLSLTVTDYDSQINGVWGPDADDEIDNKLRRFVDVPLTTIPDIIKRAANQNVEYRYYDHLHQEEKAKTAFEHYEKLMADYVAYLEENENEYVSASTYQTWPLNSDMTPYRSNTSPD